MQNSRKNADQLQKEIISYFNEIGLDQTQEDLLECSRALLNKEYMEMYNSKYISNMQYGLQRIVMLMTKMYLLTMTTETTQLQQQ